MSNPLVHAVEQCFAALSPPATARIGVACSGGPDSIALADACVELARRGGLGAVELVHVDHGLRANSADDAIAVARAAERWGIPIVTRRVTVDVGVASVEAAAREARYACLDLLVGERKYDWVALGHTASDQAETVLMRVLRGTGVTGLAGIPPHRGPYIRPLLTVWRRDVEAYVAERGLSVLSDPMNADLGLTRNRLRHHWLPALEAENPNIYEALVRLSRSCRESAEALEVAARAARPSAVRGDGSIEIEALGALPTAVQKLVLVQASADAGLEPLEAVHLDSLCALARAPTAGTRAVDLPGGRAVREYDRLLFRPQGAGDSGIGTESTTKVFARGNDGPYEVRRWRPGDRMRPVRLRGRSRKISDLFTDARIPRRLREVAWVVVRVEDGAIVWAQHIGNAYGSAVEVTLTTR